MIKDFFVPTNKNGYRPIILRKGSIAIYALMLFVFNISIGSLPLSKVYASIDTSKIIELHNQERTTAGLSKLILNSKLSASATAKAKAMLESDCWSHYCPNGKSPWDFFMDQSYDYVYAGENLAEGFTNNNTVMQAWMNSPTHRDNILKPEFKEIGIGITSGNFQGNPSNTIIVIHFGTQVDSYYNLPTTNPTEQENSNSSNIKPLVAPIIDSPVNETSTNDRYFETKGKATENSIVKILDNGNIKGSVDAEGGIFTFKPDKNNPYSEGLHSISAFYVKDDTSSNKSNEVKITVDTTSPILNSSSVEFLSTESKDKIRVRISTDSDVTEVSLNINEDKFKFVPLPLSQYWETEIPTSSFSSEDIIKITAIDSAANITSSLIDTNQVLSAVSGVNSTNSDSIGLVQRVFGKETTKLKNLASIFSILFIGLLFIIDTIVLAKTNLPEQIIRSKFHFHISSFLILLFAAVIGGIGGNILEGITR